ncbi:MAG: insulinase family protein [Proteobacteria bacterium]|nr:insulinase family protein [Pseudomonadota bacterium]
MHYKRLSLFYHKYSTRAVIIAFVLVFFFACRNTAANDHGRFFKNASTNPKAVPPASVNIGNRIHWPHEKSDLLPDPHLTFGRLQNGFGFVLMQNQYPKDRVSMHLSVQAGSMHELDDQQGLAHFLEHMLFNGSTNFEPGELVKYFQNIGMQFGPDANAHTGFASSAYDILLPKGDSDSLKQGLLVLKDYAQGALLLPSEIDKERRVVLAEKRTRDSAEYRTYVRTLAFEFPEARISKRLPIGLEAVLKNTDRRQLKYFYDTWYRPEKMVLVVVGDFNAEQAAAIIKEIYSPLTARAPPKRDPDLGAIHHQEIKPFYHFEKEAGNTSANIETLERVAPGPDSFAFQAHRLMADIANRIVQNRLDALVRKPDTPFTSAAIASGYFLKEIKYAAINADSGPENWEKSLALIEQTLRRALQYGFTKSELERVKKNIISELDIAVKKASTQNSRDLAQEIIGSLNTDKVFMSPEQEKKLFTPLVESLTLEKVHDAFRQSWAAGHRLVLVTGNADLSGMAQDPEHQILSAYNRSSKVNVSRPTEAVAVMFPYLPEPQNEGRIVRQKEISDLGIVQVDFENGVRLNIKKTDFKADEVTVRLSFGSGRSAEPVELPGLADLSTKVINESGLGRLENDELERALAGKNTTVDFGLDEDRMYFEGKTVPEEMRLMFQLLYAHMVDPGFRKDAYALAMERFSQKYQELSTTIEGGLELYGKRFLAGNDHRFGLPDHESFRRLTLDQVRSWFESSLKTQDIEISVVGQVDVDSTVKTASRYLGGLLALKGAAVPKVSGSPRFPGGQSLQVPVPTKIAKGLLIVAYQTEDIWDIHKTRRLAVLADIVSEQLREIIREKMGSAYSTYAFNRPSRAYPGYGVFHVMVFIDPKEADAVTGAVKKLISEIAEKGVTQDQLHRALAPTLTSIKDMLRKNDYWKNTVLDGSEQYPQQLDWCREIMQDYASITTEEILIMANKYLDHSRSATLIIKPEYPID